MRQPPEFTQASCRLLTARRRAGSVHRLLALLATMLATSAPTHAGDSLRCGSRLVSAGALAPAVLAACGEPAYREVWRYDDASYAQYVGDTEAWTYNFGPNQLLRILRFREGRLTRIDTDGYGFRAAGPGSCSPNDIVDGLSKYRLVSLCGEPVLKRALGDLLPDRVPETFGNNVYGYGYGNNRHRFVPGFREEWTYNFGERYLLRRVMLENGRVVAVEDGERGYDPR